MPRLRAPGAGPGGPAARAGWDPGPAMPGRPALPREPVRPGESGPSGSAGRGTRPFGAPSTELPSGPGTPAWSSGPAAWPPPGPGSAGKTVAAVMAVGSTVTASWILRPSSRDSAWVMSALSRVSSCSLTNSLGVAMSAVFSTRPSGRVSLSHARWCGSICIVASSSRDRAHTSARSVSLIGCPSLAPPDVINSFVHRLCTPDIAVCTDRAGRVPVDRTRVPGAGHPRPERCPQPKTRGWRAFGKPSVLAHCGLPGGAQKLV